MLRHLSMHIVIAWTGSLDFTASTCVVNAMIVVMQWANKTSPSPSISQP